MKACHSECDDDVSRCTDLCSKDEVVILSYVAPHILFCSKEIINQCSNNKPHEKLTSTRNICLEVTRADEPCYQATWKAERSSVGIIDTVVLMQLLGMRRGTQISSQPVVQSLLGKHRRAAECRCHVLCDKSLNHMRQTYTPLAPTG